MGNQLTGLALPALVNVEECLSEVSSSLRFEEELFGSRLFKVARVGRVDDGSGRQLVAKVFSSSSVVRLLPTYKQMIEAYSSRIPSGYNLLSFTVSSFGRNVLILREFIDQSLADRLCTRPFLCIEEKQWVAFQLLHALAQLHRTSWYPQRQNGIMLESQSNNQLQCSADKQRILCHGDIKAENVLLTSWGWVLLADPAPFKPSILPADNPSAFTHFFDSSRRRVCNVAPERFIEFQPSTMSNDASNIVESDAGTCAFPNESEAVIDCDQSGDINSLSNMNKTATDFDNLSLRIVGQTAFQTTTSAPNFQRLVTDEESRLSDFHLTAASDLFSVGCVLLELFTDGSITFTLSDLLAYKNGDSTRVTKLLSQVPCDHMKSLISRLLSLSVDDRGTADGHLVEQKGKAFPTLFYCHLQPYMKLFLSFALSRPTVRIAFLRRTLSSLLYDIGTLGSSYGLTISAIILCNLITSILRPSSTSQVVNQTPSTSATSPSVGLTRGDSVLMHESLKVNGQSLSDPSMVCSNGFSSRTSVASSELPSIYPTAAALPGSTTDTGKLTSHLTEAGKLDALVCLLQLAEHLPAYLILDRVIPFCVEFTSLIHSSEVRSLAVDALTQILRQATQKTSASTVLEVLFLTAYLFPSLRLVSSDPKLEVRLSLARCLPDLSECALRFLESHPPSCINRECPREAYTYPLCTQTRPGDAGTNLSHVLTSGSTIPVNNYGSRLSDLRSHFQDQLVTLFSDSDRRVRHALMTTSGLAKLAAFFGRSHTNGTVLSHMITLLNDKEDASLRASFYLQVSPLAIFVGAQSIGMLRPLLEQGLIDRDDCVIETSLQALTHLLRRRLLSAPVVVAFLSRAIALTAHPTVRIRQAAVSYITAFARHAVENQSSVYADNRGKVENERIRGTKRISLHAKLSGEDRTTALSSRCWSGLCSLATVYARLANAEVMNTFFSRSLRCFTNDTVLLTNLRPPICRSVMEALANMIAQLTTTFSNPGINPTKPGVNGIIPTPTDLLCQIIDLLKERKASRAVTRSGENPCYTSPSNELVALLLSKLQSLGLTELMESQMINLSHLLSNLCEKAAEERSLTKRNFAPASCRLQHIPPKYKTLELNTVFAPKLIPPAKQAPANVDYKVCLRDALPFIRLLGSLIQHPVSNYERLLRCDLFSGRIPLTLPQQHYHGDTLRSSVPIGRGLAWTPLPSGMGGYAGMRSSSSVNQGNNSDMLRASNSVLLTGCADVPVTAGLGRGRFSTDSQVALPRIPSYYSDAWSGNMGRPQGLLMAHLHEHQPGLINLAVHFSGRLMASCSNRDGNVKLWNCGLWPVCYDGYLNEASAASGYIGKQSADRAEQGVKLDTSPSGLSSNAVDSSSKVMATSGRQPGLVQSHCLPTRSSWTYRTNQQAEDPFSRGGCRDLVWTAGGSSLVTIAGGKWLHRIDVTTGQQCGLDNLISPSGTYDSQPTRAMCLVAPTCCQFPQKLLLSSAACNTGIMWTHVGGSDANLVAYATTNNCIIARDLRLPFTSTSSVWCLKQDGAHGLITSLAMHSGYTWLVVGTARGRLVSWDLRHQRPIVCTQYHSSPNESMACSKKNPSAFTGPTTPSVAVARLQMVETPAGFSASGTSTKSRSADIGQTLIVAASSLDDEVAIWDLEACTSISSVPFVNPNEGKRPGHNHNLRLNTPLGQFSGHVATFLTSPTNKARGQRYIPVRALLCLPPSPKLVGGDLERCSTLPTVITGGRDGRLRYCQFSEPPEFDVIAWGADEETMPPKLEYTCRSKPVTVEVYDSLRNTNPISSDVERSGLLTAASGSRCNLLEQMDSSISGRTVDTLAFPAAGRLELREPSKGHKNVISDISLLRTDQNFLVSASMDGVIKIWK